MSDQPPPRPGRRGPGQPPRPRPGRADPRRESPTEFIPRVDSLRGDLGGGYPAGRDGYDDRAHAGYGHDYYDHGDYDRDYHRDYDSDYDRDYDERGHDRSRRSAPSYGGRGRTVMRTIGEVFITAGLVVLLFVFYEVYVTDLFAAQKQANATSALNNQWASDANGRTDHYDLADGHGIAKMYIPALGPDYHFTIIEGTTQADLAIGPGHYTGSALPGQPGNFAVAGHRVGQGAPFNDLDLVQSCDAIIVETQTDWFVYRMLPERDEVAGWASGKGKTAQCSGVDGEGKVQPLGGEYSQTVGQEVVLPSEGDVVAPIPHYPYTTLSSGQEVALMTMTTCTPKFSASQRLVVHAVLVRDWKKDPSKPNQVPPEMKETS